MKYLINYLTITCLGLFITLGCSSITGSSNDQGPDQLAPEKGSSTVVPGHDRYDEDNNGFPDAGVYVNGKYTSVYAYDSNGDYYWDLGDGRVQTSEDIDSIDDLDESTLTTCDYQVQYRADFGNDPFMDAGWIINNINCSGHDDNGTYNYLIVHETDPRYTGNPDWSIWGSWEYHAYTVSGQGNLVRPENHVGS